VAKYCGLRAFFVRLCGILLTGLLTSCKVLRWFLQLCRKFRSDCLVLSRPRLPDSESALHVKHGFMLQLFDQDQDWTICMWYQRWTLQDRMKWRL
jgi:hypothetical protein